MAELYEARARLNELKRLGNSIPKDYASQDMYMADLKKAEEDVAIAERNVLQAELIQEPEEELEH